MKWLGVIDISSLIVIRSVSCAAKLAITIFKIYLPKMLVKSADHFSVCDFGDRRISEHNIDCSKKGENPTVDNVALSRERSHSDIFRHEISSPRLFLHPLSYDEQLTSNPTAVFGALSLSPPYLLAGGPKHDE